MADLSYLPEAPKWFANPPTHLFREDRVTEVASDDRASTDDALAEHARRTLDKLARELSCISRGSRNSALNEAAYTMGGFVASGAMIDRAEIELRLRHACEVNGLIREDGHRPFSATFRSGFESGLQRPFASEQRTEQPAQSSHRQRSKREKFRVEWFDEIKDNQTKEWLVDKVFGVGDFTYIVGKPETGKGVIVTDAACHVAAGRQWHGRSVRRGLVVYIAAERAKLTKRRMIAFRKRHVVENIPLAVIDGTPDLTSGLADAEALVTLVRKLEAERREKVVWIIIDTLSRAFGPGDQNKSQDMGKFVRAADEIIAETGAHVTVIHHTPWNEERGKGAIDLDGAVDASFVVSKIADLYRLRCDGANDGEEGLITAFRLESEPVGVDEEGNVTTAPIVIHETSAVAGMEAADGAKVILVRSRPRKAAIVFARALKEAGQEDPRTGRRAVAESELRKRLRGAFNSGTVKESSLDTIVRRNLKDLIDKGDAEKIGEWFFPRHAEASNDDQVRN